MRLPDLIAADLREVIRFHEELVVPRWRTTPGSENNIARLAELSLQVSLGQVRVPGEESNGDQSGVAIAHNMNNGGLTRMGGYLQGRLGATIARLKQESIAAGRGTPLAQTKWVELTRLCEASLALQTIGPEIRNNCNGTFVGGEGVSNANALPFHTVASQPQDQRACYVFHRQQRQRLLRAAR